MTTDELVARIDERVGSIKKVVEKIETHVTTQNRRIDKLEGWKDKIIGASIFIAFFFSTGVITFLIERFSS